MRYVALIFMVKYIVLNPQPISLEALFKDRFTFRKVCYFNDGYNDHMCAILDDGSAMLGDNLIGQLGDGTTTDSTPVAVSPMAGRTATALALGNYHSCAILGDGSIHCWGYNGYGQLGDGTNTNLNTPVAVNLPAGRTATALALGWQHSCAILDDGSAMCWGDNDYGQLGDGTILTQPHQ